MSQNAIADASHERDRNGRGVQDREPDHPIEDGTRRSVQLRPAGPHLEQNAFRRLGGDDSVQYVPRAARRDALRL